MDDRIEDLHKAYARGIVTACVEIARNHQGKVAALCVLEDAGITKGVALATRDADDSSDRSEIEKIYAQQD